jgi:hypothetical protein
MTTSIPKSSWSSLFVYEDLISHIEIIQKEIIQTDLVFTNRWKTEKRKENELKSRSSVFIDSYGQNIYNNRQNLEQHRKI